LVYQSSPSWIQNANAAPREIAEVKDFEAKYYLTMRLALEHDITFRTPNPSTILKLVKASIKINTRSSKTFATARSRRVATYNPKCARRSPAASEKPRAREETGIFDQERRNAPTQRYWPRLQLMGCWKGGTVGVRLKEFARWFAKATPAARSRLYGERGADDAADLRRRVGRILAINENFYEFIPESEIGSPAPTTLTCAEIEKGASY